MCVVLCHAVETIYCGNNAIVFEGMKSKAAFAVFHTVGRLGVPVFLMLTGALVLPKRFEDGSDFRRFWLHNLLPLVVTIEVWVVIYNVYLWAGDGTFRRGDLVRELLLVQNVPLAHWWYLPMVARLYLVLPFASVALRHVRVRWYRPAFLALFTYVYIFGTYERLRAGLGLPESVSIPASDPYSVLACTGYVVVGYLIDSRKALRGMSLPILSLLTLACLSLAWATTMAVGDAWYDNPGLLVAGAGTFETALRSAERKPAGCSRLIASLSKMSFGVYFVHMPVLRALRGVLPLGSVPHWIATLLLWAPALAISFLVVLLLWRPPRLRLLLFDAK